MRNLKRFEQLFGLCRQLCFKWNFVAFRIKLETLERAVGIEQTFRSAQILSVFSEIQLLPLVEFFYIPTVQLFYRLVDIGRFEF